MGEPYEINPQGLYTDAALFEGLGLRRNSLEKARRSGALRFTRRGGRILYLGQWIQDWITGAEEASRTEAAC